MPSEAVKRKLAAFQKKVVQEALQGKPYSPRTSEDVPVPKIRFVPIAEGAELLAALAGDPSGLVDVEVPSHEAPAVSGE